MAISALSAGLSGLNANQRALDVEANNVANIDTSNFQPRHASFQEAAPAGSGVTLSAAGRNLAAGAAPSAAPAPSGTDLASATVNSLTYGAGFQLSAQVVKAADERLGTLIDIKA